MCEKDVQSNGESVEESVTKTDCLVVCSTEEKFRYSHSITTNFAILKGRQHYAFQMGIAKELTRFVGSCLKLTLNSMSNWQYPIPFYIGKPTALRILYGTLILFTIVGFVRAARTRHLRLINTQKGALPQLSPSPPPSPTHLYFIATR